MRREIPTWVAVIVIAVVILIAVFAVWRKTGVQKEELPPEKMPGAMMRRYGAPGPMVPRGAQPGAQPTQPGAQPTQPAPSGQ